MSSELAFTFPEMLAAQEAEVARWEGWLKQQPPSLLDCPMNLAKGQTLRDVLFHIFIVQQFYGEPLCGLRAAGDPVDDLLAQPHQSVDELFALHRRGLALLRQWATTATPEDAASFMVRGGFRVSKKKCFVQAMEHTVRHLAQLAVALRQAGYPTDWPHDFLMNPSMQ